MAFTLRCERHEERWQPHSSVPGRTRRGLYRAPHRAHFRYEPEAAPQLPAPLPTLSEHITKGRVTDRIIRLYPQRHLGGKRLQCKGRFAKAPKAHAIDASNCGEARVRDSLDPANNIDGGSRYLRELLLRYNGDAARRWQRITPDPGP